MRTIAAMVTCALLCAAIPAFAAGGAAAPQIVDLTVRPSGADLARLPGRGDAYAAVYDDRLAPSALRYAERREGRWKVRIIATAIDGRPVGREPILAISRHGLRLAVFRTELDLDDGHNGNGTLYASRSADGEHWYTERIDANGFGASASFDAQGRPAIAYLVRLDTTNAAEVRLARFYDGAWHIETLARTTYRQAQSEANASSVGLALDRTSRSRSPTSIRPATRCGSSARTRARSASAPCRPRRRAPRSRSGPAARSAWSAPGWPARTRGCGSRAGAWAG